MGGEWIDGMTGLLLNLRGIYNKPVGAAPAFDPVSLFSGSETGAWYDPSDTSSMWATTTATIQTVAASAGVTATAGNLVARMDDKSGNGNHISQATISKRPILRQSGGVTYLEFDGTDDDLQVAIGSPWSNTSGLFVSMSNDKEVDNGFGIAFPCSFNQYDSGVGGRYWALGDVFSGPTINGDYGFFVAEARTSFSANNIAGVTLPADGIVRVLSGWWVPGNPTNAKVNLGSVGTSTNSITDMDANTTSTTLRIGSYASSPEFYSDANFYGGIIVGDAKTSTDRDNYITYLAGRAGVTL